MQVNILKDKRKIARALCEFLIDENVYKELGEPILFKENCVFFIAFKDEQILGFCSIQIKNEYAFLNNVYVDAYNRKKGVFRYLSNEYEKYCIDSAIKIIKCVSTEMALPIYLNKGFQIEKSFTKYFKLIKKL